jgi:hypothetical protein
MFTYIVAFDVPDVFQRSIKQFFPQKGEMFLVGCAVPRTSGGGLLRAEASSNIGAGDCSGTAFAQNGECVTNRSRRAYY